MVIVHYLNIKDYELVGVTTHTSMILILRTLRNKMMDNQKKQHKY